MRAAKQARSIATREKLIAAALDVIYEFGLDTLTTQMIVERAETSRGALLHHFATRDAIIEAAISHSMNEVLGQIREVASRLGNKDIDTDQFVDALWNIFNHRFMFIAMEHIVESRTNPSMREYLLPSVRLFHQELNAAWEGVLKNRGVPSEESKIALSMSLSLIRGMQLQTIYLDDPQYYHTMLHYWKRALRRMLDPNGK